MPPSVPTRPAGGGSVASAWGQWAHDWLRGRDTLTGNANLTLSTSYQDLAGLSKVVAAGWYVVLCIFDLAITSAGAGQLDGVLNVDGVDLQGTATFQPASTATGEGSVAQVYMFQAVGTVTVKMRAKKSIAAGTATCVGTNSRMMFL